MSDPAPFLRAIWEQPEEDGPRLVYADWLDEQGEAARAEFIRVQCERQRLAWDIELGRSPATDDRIARLRLLLKRQEELLKRHEGAWRSGLPKLPGIEWGPLERGFVEKVVAQDAAALRRHAAQVFQAAPVSRVFILQRLTGPGARALAGLPELGRVGALDLTSALEPGALRALLDASGWDRLTTLMLTHNTLSRADLQALASADLPALQVLRLDGTRLNQPAIPLLARSGWLPRLTQLYLTENALGDGGALALAQTDWPELELLTLGWNRIGDPGGRALAASPRLEKLRRLVLSGNPLRESRERLWNRFGDRVRI